MDACSWAAALTIATWLRYDFDFSKVNVIGLLYMTSAAIAMMWIAGLVTQMHLGRYATGSLDEVLNLTRVQAVVGIFLLCLDLLHTIPPVPRSVPPTAAVLALVLSLAARLLVRDHRARKMRPNRTSAQRAIIYGAGTRGQEVIRSMLSGAAGQTLPVALLDDDPDQRHLRISGVPVRGTRRDISDIATETGATLLVIAVRNPGAGLLSELAHVAKHVGIDVKVPSQLSEMFRPRVNLAALNDPDVAHLLGRRQIDTGVGMLGGHLRCKRVLVTGAGGSIGSELCRQIQRFGPAELFMLDRDESALHAVRLSIYGDALLDSPDVILSDIRDPDVIRGVFELCRPSVVFHAAALKHLPMLEQYPLEAWKTNVLGTLNVLNAARAVGVETFVNISTDKAANPVSVLGRSKRLGERITADTGNRGEGTFLSVRFGNVLGSRGSVLTTFAWQVANSWPITVTHPDVTRYFMTVSEAVQLVIHAATIGKSGEALVLDMGEPVRIVDVARRFARMAGSPAEIIYTGLRAGEKLHEELYGCNEKRERPLHPSISHVIVPPLDPDDMESLALLRGEMAAMAELAQEHGVAAVRPEGRVT